MPVPAEGLPQALQEYLGGLEERIAQLELPQGPQAVFGVLAAGLTAGNAITGAGRACIVTDLKTWAWSDGVHWRRTDTGAVIV